VATVWILGAGFSKPLGGPLLKDLLWPEVLNKIATTYEEERFPKLRGGTVTSALWLYQFGTRFARGHGDLVKVQGAEEGAQFWDNPEEYLDLLDVAAQDDSSRAAKLVSHSLRKYWGKALQPISPDKLSAAARRIVAAECSAFLEGIDLPSERFLPYRRWAAELAQPGDSVITFNYDRVIERVGGDGGTRFVIPAPAQLAVQRDYPGRVIVYKLHGSVDWRWNRQEAQQDMQIVTADNERYALDCEDSELAIASPGSQKLGMASRQLAPLWEAAMAAVSRANNIVFVGYGFPQTDAFAKQKLIGAIRDNHEKLLNVHVVLGPDRGSTPVVRLEGMLRHALSARLGRYSQRGIRTYELRTDYRYFDLRIHPLYAEDFFTVVELPAIETPQDANDF